MIYALVDERVSDKCSESLASRGFSVIKLPKIDRLPAPIASHTDIICFSLGGKLFFSESYFKANFDTLSPLLPNISLLTREEQGVNYPLDAIFNGLLLSGRLFCKSDSFCREIIEYAENEGFEIISVKQGYPACVTLKVGESAVVTADRGMARVLTENGISVLTIENGDIALPPYEYGFIGGCAGAFGSEIFFLGDIKKHRSGEKICEFIEMFGKKAVSLSDEPLSDLGGIIFTEIS